MKFLIQKDEDHTSLLRKICSDTLRLELNKLTPSDEFCGIYIDGRNREINFAEDFAALHSFKFFSEYDYPFLVLSPNSNNLFNKDPKYNRVHHIKIPECDSHTAYSDFLIKNIWEYVPKNFEKLLFMQSDGFLIKKGWEQFILNCGVDYIGSAWCHTPGIEIFKEGEWKEMIFPRVQCGNGGFSFRKRSACEKVSEIFSNLQLRELERRDNKAPLEDLFYSYFINGVFGRTANLQQCMKFSVDPITPSEYEEKISFGFHHPKNNNEFQKYRDFFLSL